MFFLDKTILSDFTFYAIFNINKIYWKVPLHLLVKWEVVSQIVERDIWHLYPLYPLFPCSDFVSQMWGGGGVMFFSHFMLFMLGIQNNYFSFNVLYAGNIVKCPFTYSYWLNGRWFLQIVDIGILSWDWKYWKVPHHLLVKWGEAVSPNRIDIHVGNFNMKLTGRWFPQIVDRDSGNLYPMHVYI